MAKNNIMEPYGLGRRKAAVAQVILTGKPDVRTVNGLSMEEYFPTVGMQAIVLGPLQTTDQLEKTGFKAKISGGGKQSQAGALKLALARALVVRDESYRKQLKDNSALTRDPRVKERKKFGLKGARRAPQFSKR
jgi:small subunit ribosomal protein S9